MRVHHLNCISSCPLGGHLMGSYHREMDHDKPYCTPGLQMYQVMMEKDRRARLDNQRRLRELRRRHGSEVRVFCSHDPLEYEELSGRPMGSPIATRRPVAA